MGLQKCGLNLNHSQKELQPHGTLEFPCAGYASFHTSTPGDRIPWHWHEELEIIYIKEGTMKLRVPSKEYIINSGKLAVINSNLPHEATGNPSCSLESLVFSPLLVAGSYSSAIYKKYIQPLIDCPDFTCFAGLQQADSFCLAFNALANDTTGYEMIVQEQLSHILLALYRELAPVIDRPHHSVTPDTNRLEHMLSYIHNHYSENITLSDIAKAADIGERECLRCFKRTISESPMQYLLKHRLMQGANQLVNNPAASISEISDKCGFEYTSYFAKQFRRFYLCSPREYRKKFESQNVSD